VLKEQFSGVSETLNIIKEIMGADSTDVATQIRTMAAIVSNARSLIEVSSMHIRKAASYS